MSSSFSLSQQRTLAILPKVSGILSIIGSAFIIQDVLFTQRRRQNERRNERRQTNNGEQQQQQIYHRLLLGASIIDCFLSFSFFLSTWPMVPYSQQLNDDNESITVPIYAVGTTATCTFQGFFIQMGVMVPLYNLGLTIYYSLVLIRNWSNFQFISYRFEVITHTCILCFGVGTAIVGIPLKLYNNSNLWCWFSSLPTSCSDSVRRLVQDDNEIVDNDGVDVQKMTEVVEVGCDRGENAWIYRWAFLYGPVWLAIIVITILMLMISYHVHRIETKSRKWRDPSQQFPPQKNGQQSRLTSSGSLSIGLTDSRNDINDVQTQEEVEQRSKDRTEQQQKRHRSTVPKKSQGTRHKVSSTVFWQCTYYIMVFYLTWIFPTVVRLFQTLHKPTPFWLFAGMCVCLPLQGFLNFGVYIRPRTIRYYNHFKVQWMMVEEEDHEQIQERQQEQEQQPPPGQMDGDELQNEVGTTTNKSNASFWISLIRAIIQDKMPGQ